VGAWGARLISVVSNRQNTHGLAWTRASGRLTRKQTKQFSKILIFLFLDFRASSTGWKRRLATVCIRADWKCACTLIQRGAQCPGRPLASFTGPSDSDPGSSRRELKHNNCREGNRRSGNHVDRRTNRRNGAPNRCGRATADLFVIHIAINPRSIRPMRLR
jgi:hypothetical protein